MWLAIAMLGTLGPRAFSKTTLKNTHFHMPRVTGSDASYQVESAVPSLQTRLISCHRCSFTLARSHSCKCSLSGLCLSYLLVDSFVLLRTVPLSPFHVGQQQIPLLLPVAFVD